MTYNGNERGFMVSTVLGFMLQSIKAGCRQEYYCETDFKGDVNCGFKLVCDF